MSRHEGRVDPCQDRYPPWFHPFVEQPVDALCRYHGQIFTRRGRHLHPGDLVGSLDLLLDPSTVVGDEILRCFNSVDGTPVIDLERVRSGAGEESVEVDEICGIGSGVAVDHLIVVADSEDVQPRRSEQPDEQ